MVTETLTIVGLEWPEDSPVLRVRRGDHLASEMVPLAGMEINYRVAPDALRRCVGHNPFRQPGVAWVDCPNAPLHDGYKCDRCAAVDATFASQLHHAHNKATGELDSAVVGHLQQPNDLYLAAFRDGSLKVGTSTRHRTERRLLEQGAWAARVVASATDGRAIRVLEDRVTEELGIPQTVSIVRKIDGVLRPLPDHRLAAELDMWRSRVHELVDRLADESLVTAADDWTFPGANDAVWHRLHRYPRKLSSGTHDIVFLTASGRVVVVGRRAGDDRFVADVRSLYGRVLELGDHRPDELAVQDSLF